MPQPVVRAYLAGRLSVEIDGTLIDQDEFVGPQGRAAFAFLVIERSHPVSRADLADVLWPDDPPPSIDTALNAIISKVRSALVRGGLDRSVLVGSSGCYELRLPGSTWVDVEAAADAIHEAEIALRNGDPQAAYGPSAVAHHIARRPFLTGDDSPWAQARRARQRSILLRALACRAEVYLWNREYTLAVEAASSMIELEPFREHGYQLLMRAHAAGGNTAEALRTYERCRRLIAEELGVDPSPATKAVHLSLVQTL